MFEGPISYNKENTTIAPSLISMKLLKFMFEGSISNIKGNGLDLFRLSGETDLKT